jgi:hypothetical protein
MLYLRLMLKGFLLAVLMVLLGFGYMAWSIARYADEPATQPQMLHWYWVLLPGVASLHQYCASASIMR